MLLIMLKRVKDGYFIETREGLLGRSEEFAAADRASAEALVSQWFDVCDLGGPDNEVKLPPEQKNLLLQKKGYRTKCRSCGRPLDKPKRWTRAQCKQCKKQGLKIQGDRRR